MIWIIYGNQKKLGGGKYLFTGLCILHNKTKAK